MMDYDVDYSNESSGDYDDYYVVDCSDETPIAIPILYLFISSIGMLANSAVIYIIMILREYQKTVTNIYVLQLAIADFLFLFILPFEAVTLFEKKWIYSVGWCKISESIRLLNYYSSIMFLTMMSFDRYLAINLAMNTRATKLRSKTAASVFSVLIWFFGCMAIMYVMIKAQVVGCDCVIVFDSGHGKNTNFSFDESKNPFSEMKQNVSYDNIVELLYGSPIHCSLAQNKGLSTWFVLNFIIAFVFPLLVITICYIQILRKISRPTSKGITSKNSNRTRKRITYMVTALVAVFITCWLPYHSFNLARVNNLLVSKYTCDSIQYFTLVLAYLNSALNPFFYTFMGTNIKRRWHNALSRTRSFKLSVSARSQYSQGSSHRHRRKSSCPPMLGNGKSLEEDSTGNSNNTKHTILISNSVKVSHAVEEENM